MDDKQHLHDLDASQNGLVNMEESPEEQEWTQKGNTAAEEEDYDTAAEAFQHAVAINPNNARSRYNLALAQQYQGDTEEAIAGYRRAIDLDPELIVAYSNLGNLYGEMGMEEEALETFQQALEYDPDNDKLYTSVGDAYRQQYLYTDAIQAYRQALILNPDNSQAADSLRDVRERVNYQLRRVMDQEKSIDDDPGDTSRYAELVNLYLDMHRYDDAISAANQILGLDPEDRAGYDAQ
ncbi:MAG TPA: tetratricopeptide repeat protein, partial [Ktedonobacteraceae bacterium]